MDKTHYRHSSLDGDQRSKADRICRALRREFEHSLDIQSALKGQFVVKPQDEDKSKAAGGSAGGTNNAVGLESSTPPKDNIVSLRQDIMTARFKYKHNGSSVSSNNIGHSSLGPHRYHKL